MRRANKHLAYIRIRFLVTHSSFTINARDELEGDYAASELTGGILHSLVAQYSLLERQWRVRLDSIKYHLASAADLEEIGEIHLLC